MPICFCTGRCREPGGSCVAFPDGDPPRPLPVPWTPGPRPPIVPADPSRPGPEQPIPVGIPAAETWVVPPSEERIREIVREEIEKARTTENRNTEEKP